MDIKQLPIKHRDLYTPYIWSKEYIQKLIDEPSEPEDYPNALIDIKNCINQILPKRNKNNVAFHAASFYFDYLLVYMTNKEY